MIGRHCALILPVQQGEGGGRGCVTISLHLSYSRAEMSLCPHPDKSGGTRRIRAKHASPRAIGQRALCRFRQPKGRSHSNCEAIMGRTRAGDRRVSTRCCASIQEQDSLDSLWVDAVFYRVGARRSATQRARSSARLLRKADHRRAGIVKAALWNGSRI